MKYEALVINLRKDVDRLISMNSIFSELGIHLFRFDAINGYEYLEKNKDSNTTEYNPTMANLKNGQPLSVGELGCALSHKRCAEYLLAENDKNSKIAYLLVCEDDISIVDKRFKYILEKSIEDNERYHEKTGSYSWEYLQFDYQKPGFAWVQSWFNQSLTTYKVRLGIYKKMKHFVFSLCKLPLVLLYGLYEGIRNTVYRGNVSFYRDVYFAGCYLIHIHGAKKLLALSDPIVYPADRIQNESKKINNLKIRYYCPLIVFQQRKKFKSNLGV